MSNPVPTQAFPDLTRDDVFMIGTERLWLRWPRLEDAEAIAAFSGHPDVATKTGSWPVAATADLARERIAKTRAANMAGTGFAFAIARADHWAGPIGLIGLSVGQDDQGLFARVGYQLAPDVWGHGYTSEALTGLIKMTRLLTRLPRLTADVMPHNVASAAVLVKNGFCRTGQGHLTTEFRGTFAVDQYARQLRAADHLAAGPRPMPIKPVWAGAERLAS